MDRRRIALQAVWFFGSAYLWTWVWLAVPLVTGMPTDEMPGAAFRLVSGLGPAVAAASMLWFASAEVRVACRELLVRLPGRLPTSAVVVMGLAAGPGVVAALVHGGGRIGFDPQGASAVVGMVAFAAAASLIEEPGWRGCGLGVLRHRLAPLPASLVLAAAWALWHLPLYLVHGSFQHDTVGLGSVLFWAFTAGFFPQSILMTWIVEAPFAGGVLAAAWFHFWINVSGEALTLSTGAQWTRVALWWIAAAGVIAVWYRRQETAQPSISTSAPESSRRMR